MMHAAARNVLLGLVMVAFCAAPGRARQVRSDIQDAFQLERRGRFEDAADGYRELLRTNPANLSALNGLERVLKPLGQLDSLLPFADSALSREPNNHSVHGLKLRTLRELGQREALDAAGETWAGRTPNALDPYATWAEQLLALRDVAGARLVLQRGVDALGDGGDMLHQALAEVSAMDEEWVEAALHWRHAMSRNPSLFSAAVTGLQETPENLRRRVVDELTRENDDGNGRVASDLWLIWEAPEQAWVWLDNSLPSDQQASLPILRRFADRASRLGTKESYRAQGFALETLANRSNGPAIRRARLESAAAFAKAGESASADRMLQLAGVGRDSQEGGGEAVATLIGVMVESGRIEEAQEQYAEWRDRMPLDDADILREQLVWGWIRRGSLNEAEDLLEQDSTVSVLALRGWISLYRGDLAAARGFLMQAGPRAGNRTQSTERASMLAVLQPISVDSSVSLGRGLLLLAQGDSTAALTQLEEAAGSLAPDGGRVTVLVLAGRVALSLGRPVDAERLLSLAVASDAGSPSAPSAAFHLAEAYAQRGLTGQAVTQLEDVILSFPESAIVPLARRLLAELKS